MGEYSERALDEIFFALSHQTRRRMLTQLAGARESRVTDLARWHRLSLNTVSKHIAVLERSRLVKRRVSGREHLIRLDLVRVEEAQRWLDHHRAFWTNQLAGLADFFNRQSQKGSSS